MRRHTRRADNMRNIYALNRRRGHVDGPYGESAGRRGAESTDLLS